MNSDTPIISILVPIYNIESYLRRCIDSVLSQDFLNYELVLVDDGSTDNSPSICDEYAAKENDSSKCDNKGRIVVIHKQNGGLPSARKAGFVASKGKYLVFLDGDDYLLPGGLSILYQNIIEGFDVVKAMTMREDNHGNRWTETTFKYGTGDVSGNDKIMEHWLSWDICAYLHGTIYRRELFSEKTFDPLIAYNITIGEDSLTNSFVYPKVEKIRFIKESVYVYCINKESMINSSVRSFEYYDRIRECMRSQVLDLSSKMRDIQRMHEVMADFRLFFIPEISFNFKKYNDISPYLNSLKKSNYNELPSKYYWFSGNRYLFYLYTSLFKFLYKWIKLKGVSRHVLR